MKIIIQPYIDGTHSLLETFNEAINDDIDRISKDVGKEARRMSISGVKVESDKGKKGISVATKEKRRLMPTVMVLEADDQEPIATKSEPQNNLAIQRERAMGQMGIVKSKRIVNAENQTNTYKIRSRAKINKKSTFFKQKIRKLKKKFGGG